MNYLKPDEYVEDERRRDAYDMLPSGYYRYALDRGIFQPQGEFFRFDGVGLIEAARKQYEKDGSLHILDAGCGTGHQLWDFMEYLERTIPPQDITATGVSDIDFSEESESWRVREAVKTGEINYAVADLNVDMLPAETFNVIYSYEVLVHNEEDPGRIVANFWQALRPGGVMYFNAEGSQRGKIAGTVADILEMGGDVFMNRVEAPLLQAPFYEKTNQTRDAYRIQKPEW